MSNKNEKFQETNMNYESVIILKNNERLRKNKLVIFPIPINITKSKYRDIKYLTKKEPSFNSFLFPNYSLNSTKNLSISKEKSKSKSKNKDNQRYDITISHKFRKYRDDLERTKIKINNLSEIISENNRTLYELKNEIKNLEINKKILKTDLQNKISNMETLEENCKNAISDINNNDFNNKYYLNAYENLCMELTLEDIKINNKEKYIKRIFETFNKLNINEYQENKFLEFITVVVSKAYFDFFVYLNNKKKCNINSLIDKFFNVISSGIISYKNICKLSQIVAKFILRILFKINILSESIGDTINYLKNKYEMQKNDLNQKIDEIKKIVMDLNKQKLNLELIEKNKKENLEFFSIKNSPFCERTVSKNKDKKKELALSNKISSIMRIYTEYNNKSKSYSLKKKTIRKIYKKEKKNLCKFLTSNCKELSDIQSQEYSRCHSNLSQSKLSTNGVSIICSPPENKNKNKFKSKINLNLNNKLNNLINISKNEETSNEKMNKLKEYEYNIINKNNTSFNSKKYKKYDSFMKNHKIFKKLKNLTKNVKNGEDKSNQIRSPTNKDFNASIKKTKKNNLSYAVSLKYMKIPKNKSGFSISSRKNIKYNNYVMNKCPMESNCNKKLFSKFKKISINKSLISKSERPNKIQISVNNSDRNEISKTKNDFKKADIMESFCYYKLIEKNSNLFNPLNIKLNLNKLGYNEGFISISSNQLYLILKPKNALQINSPKNLLNINYNNNSYNTFNSIENKNSTNSKANNTIIIRLKKIGKIYIDKTMQNIIKIRKIFLKYNNNNNTEMITKNNIYINKILNEKEIVNIKDMDQSEKIRAGLCNFFSLVIEFDNEKNMEIVLVNFCQFITWYNYLEEITRKNNFKYKYLVPNGNNSNLMKYKKNLSKIKSFKNKRENLFVKRSFSEKNNDKYNL